MPKPDSEFEAAQRENARLAAGLARFEERIRTGEQDNRALEKRVEDLEAAVRELNPGLNLRGKLPAVSRRAIEAPPSAA